MKQHKCSEGSSQDVHTFNFSANAVQMQDCGQQEQVGKMSGCRNVLDPSQIGKDRLNKWISPRPNGESHKCSPVRPRLNERKLAKLILLHLASCEETGIMIGDSVMRKIFHLLLCAIISTHVSRLSFTTFDFGKVIVKEVAHILD